MTDAERALQAYLSILEEIEGEHAEIGDTSVREALAGAINRRFVWNHMDESVPTDFGMFTATGNELVANATKIFLEDISQSDIAKLPIGAPRHNFIENASVRSVKGKSPDHFFGSGPLLPENQGDETSPSDQRLPWFSMLTPGIPPVILGLLCLCLEPGFDGIINTTLSYVMLGLGVLALLAGSGIIVARLLLIGRLMRARSE